MNDVLDGSLLKALARFEFADFCESVRCAVFLSVANEFLLYPWILQRVFCCNAQVRILSQQLLNEINALFADFCIMQSIYTVNTFLDFGKNLSVVRTVEWCTAREHGVKDAANRPDITFFGVVTFNHLWCNVVTSA